jgi:hypothetical protein
MTKYDIYTAAPAPPTIRASASLYSADCRALENALTAGREFARKHGHVFEGMQIEIDVEGGVHVHIIGIDSFKL